MKNLIGPPFASQTPESFYDYVTSLYEAPDTVPFSKSAEGVRLSWNKKGTLTVKCQREQKTLTEVEVAALAAEYQQDLETLKQELTRRSFQITNAEGVVTNAKPKRTRRGRAAKSDAERNAHLHLAERQATRADQLFQSEPTTNVPQEGALQPGLGPSLP